MAVKKERRAAPRKPAAKGESRAELKPSASSEAAPRASRPDVTPTASASASEDEIRRLVAEAAYFRAKARGFAPGHELEDWIQAEDEVKQRRGTAA